LAGEFANEIDPFQLKREKELVERVDVKTLP